jgi:hypothetical protein
MNYLFLMLLGYRSAEYDKTSRQLPCPPVYIISQSDRLTLTADFMCEILIVLIKAHRMKIGGGSHASGALGSGAAS